MRIFQYLFAGIIFCLVMGNMAAGQSPAWQRINPVPFETYIKDCQLLDNGRVVAVGNNAAIVVSDDFGESWDIQYNPAEIPFFVGLNTLSFQGNTGYAAGSHFCLLKSENGGTTWSKLLQNSTSGEDKYNDVELLPSGNVYMVENGESLLKSIDGGITWDIIFHEDSLTFWDIHFMDDLNGYTKASAEKNEYILRTTDSGNNWDLVELNIPFENSETGPLYFIDQDTGFIGLDTAYDSFIFKTTNGGGSWYQVHNSPVTRIGQFNFHNSDTGFSMGSVIWYSNNLLRTVDGGESWEIMSDQIGRWFLSTFDIAGSGNGIFMGDNGQVVKSTNWGAQWEYLSSMFLYKFSVDHCFVINDSSVIASIMGGGGGAMDIGVIQSNDHGISWSRWEDFYGNIFSICYMSEQKGFCCASDLVYYDEHRLMKTADGGVNWEIIELLPVEIDPRKVLFINNDTGYVGGPRYNQEYGFSLYKTEDGGNTWTPIEHELFDAVDIFKDFEFFNDSSAILVGDLYPFDDHSQILVTTNSGIDWEMDTLYVHPYDFLEVHYVNPDTGLLFGVQKICRTIDGGQNWYQIDFDYNYALNSDMAISFADELSGYLSIRTTYQDPISILLRTDDAGESWYEIENPSTAKNNSMDFFSKDEGIIVGNTGTIFRTENGGMVGMPEWPVSETNLLKIFPNPSNGDITIKTPDGFSSGIIMIQTIEGKTILVKEYSDREIIKSELAGQAGVYLVTLISAGKSISGKLLLLRR